jgi:hypothetical protein
MHITRIFFATAVLIALLLMAASAYGLPLLQIPQVPHPIEDQQDCLECHDTGQVVPFPEDHEGRENESCVMCHEAGEAEPAPPVPHSLEGREDCLECHDTGQVVPFPEDHEGRENESCVMCHEAGQAEPAPPVPHSLEGREDCLECHDTGQVVPFPEDHEGWENDSCVMCHEVGEVEVPAATPEPTATLPPSVEVVPTPIQEPVLFEENTCISCHEGLGGKHAEITTEWSEGVHAAQGVGCVSCHGGDPTQEDAELSMSPEAGYLGPLPKDRIPGLCGSCHSRVELMRPFDLPTDQLSQYWQSLHGQALLEGDENVATCFDCHDGHRVLKASDPASQVYPSNEPAMCAGCHSDEALMAPYQIPTNQYELYQDSVHGVALLDNQDLRAPTCSTCHGTHGAAPPGFQQVANVCGQCHTATQEYYMEGAHRTGMTGEAAPRCVTCHGRYDVPPATRDLFVGTEERHCGSCHPPGSEIGGQVEAMHQVLTEADETFEQAEVTIAEAVERRLIMAEQEETLQKANTPLIESRALQHNVNLDEIQAKADESIELSQQAQASAKEALRDLDTRYVGMGVAVVVIVLTIIALVLIKRELDRDLEAKRARRRGDSPTTTSQS